MHFRAHSGSAPPVPASNRRPHRIVQMRSATSTLLGRSTTAETPSAQRTPHTAAHSPRSLVASIMRCRCHPPWSPWPSRFCPLCYPCAMVRDPHPSAFFRILYSILPHTHGGGPPAQAYIRLDCAPCHLHRTPEIYFTTPNPIPCSQRPRCSRRCEPSTIHRRILSSYLPSRFVTNRTASDVSWLAPFPAGITQDPGEAHLTVLGHRQAIMTRFADTVEHVCACFIGVNTYAGRKRKREHKGQRKGCDVYSTPPPLDRARKEKTQS